MTRHLIRAGESRPALDMPHAAYQAACRVRNYAEWFSWPSLFSVISRVSRIRWVSATRHIPQLLQCAQEGQELVIGAEAARSDGRGCGPSECRFLQGQVSVKVDLSRVHRLVPEPERDDGGIHAGSEQLHGGAVPQDMWRDALAPESRTAHGSELRILAHQVLHAVGAQASAASVRKEHLGRRFRLFEPGPEDRRGPRGERCRAVLAALPAAANVCTRAEGDGRSIEARELREPQPSMKRQGQKRVIAPAKPSVLIGSGEHGLDLLVREKGHHRSGLTLVRNGEHALDVCRESRLLERCVVEERADRGQPRIAGAGATASLLFETGEEASDQIRIQVRQVELRRTLVAFALSKAQQQTERVAVGGDRMGTYLALCEEALGEKALQQCRQGRGAHGDPPQRRSRRNAACFSSSGWAERYQYVSAMFEWPRYVERVGIWRSISAPARDQRSSVSVAKRCLKSCRRGPRRICGVRSPTVREIVSNAK